MSLPYIKLYATDFDADTGHLDALEIGVYFRMILTCWNCPSCEMPSNIDWIADKIVKRRDDEDRVIEAIKKVIKLHWKKGSRGKIYNKKLREIYEESLEKTEKRRKAGKQGGKAKSLKTNDLSPSNAKAMLKHPEPEPEPEVDIEEIDKSIPSIGEGGIDFQKEFWGHYPFTEGQNLIACEDLFFDNLTPEEQIQCVQSVQVYREHLAKTKTQPAYPFVFIRDKVFKSLTVKPDQVMPVVRKGSPQWQAWAEELRGQGRTFIPDNITVPTEWPERKTA